MSSQGRQRARCFSWSDHVDRLLVLAEQLLESERERN
jgi:hypothetical protein